MALLLPAATLLLAALHALSHLWSTFAPGLGIRALYYRREVGFALTILSVTLAIVVVGTTPTAGHFLLLAVVAALNGVSSVVAPGRVLPALDDPRPVRLGGHDQLPAHVLGTSTDTGAHAWSLQDLIPHHIVNDSLDGRPITATW